MKLHLVAGLGCTLVALAGIASGAQKAAIDEQVSPYGTNCVAVVCQPKGCAVSLPGDTPIAGTMGIAVLVGAAALRVARRRAR